jgi:hypothetical protein
MATAGGLIIGAVGLGSLYSTCVECYCVFHKIRAFDRDSEYLGSKLKTEGALLMQWGDRVGLLSGNKRDIDPQLHDPWMREAVAEILGCIEILLTDTKKLQTTYGLIPHERSCEAIGAGALDSKQARPHVRTHTRPSANIRLERKQVNILRKFHWSIIDQEKFNDLITELRDLVQRLNDLAPPKSDAPESRTVGQSIPGLPGFGGGSERGYCTQHQHREGASRAYEDPRKQDEPRTIMAPPCRSSGRALVMRPKVDEITRTQNTQVQGEDDGSYKIYRYYRIT